MALFNVFKKIKYIFFWKFCRYILIVKTDNLMLFVFVGEILEMHLFWIEYYEIKYLIVTQTKISENKHKQNYIVYIYLFINNYILYDHKSQINHKGLSLLGINSIARIYVIYSIIVKIDKFFCIANFICHKCGHNNSWPT